MSQQASSLGGAGLILVGVKGDVGADRVGLGAQGLRAVDGFFICVNADLIEIHAHSGFEEFLFAFRERGASLLHLFDVVFGDLIGG